MISSKQKYILVKEVIHNGFLYYYHLSLESAPKDLVVEQNLYCESSSSSETEEPTSKSSKGRE